MRSGDLSETAAACDGGVTLTSPRGQIISGWNSAENKVDYDHKSYCGWKFQRPSNSAAGDYSASTLTIYIEHFSMEPDYDRVHLGSAQDVDIKDRMRGLVDSYSYKDDLKGKWESRALPDPPVVADYSGQIILTGIMELNSGQQRARRCGRVRRLNWFQLDYGTFDDLISESEDLRFSPCTQYFDPTIATREMVLKPTASEAVFATFFSDKQGKPYDPNGAGFVMSYSWSDPIPNPPPPLRSPAEPEPRPGVLQGLLDDRPETQPKQEENPR